MGGAGRVFVVRGESSSGDGDDGGGCSGGGSREPDGAPDAEGAAVHGKRDDFGRGLFRGEYGTVRTPIWTLLTVRGVLHIFRSSSDDRPQFCFTRTGLRQLADDGVRRLPYRASSVKLAQRVRSLFSARFSTTGKTDNTEQGCFRIGLVEKPSENVMLDV